MRLGFIRNGKIIQIKEIAEIPVMLDGLCTPSPPPPPPPTPRNGKIIQIKEIAEIPVMPDGLCTPSTPPPPTTHTHTHTVPSATTLWDTFIITLLGRHFTCPPCANNKWDKGIKEAHPKAFASTRLQ